jgi:DNA-binding CsgD family transcriptional regulator
MPLTASWPRWWADEMAPRAVAGRHRETQTVAGVLRGEAGLGALLLVGEAGVGKSRLVEAAVDAVEDDVAVLTGWCTPAADALPLLPIIDVLRSLSDRDSGELLASLAMACPGFVRDEVARLLPEQPGTPETARDIDPDAGRRRAFEAVRRMLSEWSARQPAAVIVEDVHWADRETCELLDYLLTPGRRTGVPMVLTCRPEHDASAEVVSWLQRWQRLDSVQRIDLVPLNEADTAAQIAALVDQPTPRGFAAATYARSEGNPFFTEQLVAWAVTASFRSDVLASLPPGLTSLLLSRTRRVAGPSRDVLSVLAVAARPVSEPDLALLIGRSDAKTRGALSELHALDLLRASRGNEVELRHALLAEAVQGDLLPAERQDLHARLADLLIAQDHVGDAARICGHVAAAGRARDELHWRIVAARDAERVFALTAAADHWQRAITLWDDVDDAESVAGLSYFELYENTRDALSDSGGDISAGALTEAVFARLGESASGDVAVRMYRALGHYREYESLEAGISAYVTAIDFGSQLPPSRDYVRALEGYCAALRSKGDFGATNDLIERALTAARIGGFKEQERDLLASQAEALVDRGLFVPARALIEQSMQVELGDDARARGVGAAVSYDYVMGNINELRRAIASSVPAIHDAERAGFGEALYVQKLRANVAEAMTELGDIAAAAALIDPITEGCPTWDTAFVYLHRVHLDLLRGEMSRARTFWMRDDPVPWRNTLHQRWEMLWRRAEFELWIGSPRQALQSVRKLVEDMVSTDMAPMTARLFALAARACADLAENNPKHRGEIVADLDQLLELLLHAKVNPFAGPMPVTAPSDGLLTRAERTRAAGQPAADIWAEAAANLDALDRPHRAAYARWRQAEALLARRGSHADAADLLRHANSQATQHVPLTNAIHNLARQARIALSQHDRASPQPAPSPLETAPFGLTGRELTVLRLVAEGLTNAEIGAALYISPKTASVHVTHIMQKLHVGSRVQAATIAERAGLLVPGSSPAASEPHEH